MRDISDEEQVRDCSVNLIDVAISEAAVTGMLCTANAAMLAPTAVNTGVDYPELVESQPCSHLACAAAIIGAGYAEVVKTLLKASLTTLSGHRLIGPVAWRMKSALHMRVVCMALFMRSLPWWSFPCLLTPCCCGPQ